MPVPATNPSRSDAIQMFPQINNPLASSSQLDLTCTKSILLSRATLPFVGRVRQMNKRESGGWGWWWYMTVSQNGDNGIVEQLEQLR